MSRRFFAASILIVGFISSLVRGQQAPPPLPPQGPAALLHVRFLGPRGMHVAFYQGLAPVRDFEGPVEVGLRPGYVYRVRLQGMTDFPGVALYPSLEVRGSLQLPATQHAANYPAPITLTEDDIRRIESGALITKIVYLENPDKATPIAARPGQPLEADAPAEHGLLEEVRTLGRPMVIVRIGERSYGPSELAQESVPGTILLPGQRALPNAQRPPWIPWSCVRVYDPILGPRCAEEECFHDGGDVGLPAGIGPNGRLGGLDPTDTVAEYTDNLGKRRLTKSNRICICAPRFAILRATTPLAGYNTTLVVASAGALQQRIELQHRVPTGQAEQVELLAALKGRERPSGTQASTGLFEAVNANATAIIGRLEGTNVIGAVLEKPAQEHPAKPLCLHKWASTDKAQVGDVITFYLQYSNEGGQPITDVVVSDSLSGRLEYIPGSARTDRSTVFTMQANQAGSSILRWEVGGKLLPGTSGLISFQARVR
jgi:uncharacterized repeat protein (TIGR01451 family)